MSWFQIVLAWLIHAAGLGALAQSQEVSSPEIITTYADGRKFSTVLRTVRIV